jgi:glycosyltransferase involved in cell wall biosynthesis
VAETVGQSPEVGPLVSVIIPTHRSPPLYLNEAVASVMDQTWTRWELVVVDDGSPDPDAVPTLLRDLDPRVRIIRTPNGGLSSARNLGVANTKGPLVSFLDYDDVWFPDHLAKAVRALTEDPVAVAAYSDIEITDKTEPGHGRVVGGGGVDRHSVLSGGIRPSMNAFVIRREALVAVGGFESRYDGSEDIDLHIKLIGMGPFVHVDTLAAIYRMHDQNVTRDTRHTAEAQDTVVRDHLLRFTQKGDVDAVRDLRGFRRHSRRFYAGKGLADAVARWRAKQYGAAAGLVWWSLRFSPVGVIGATGTLLARPFGKGGGTTDREP